MTVRAASIGILCACLSAGGEYRHRHQAFAFTITTGGAPSARAVTSKEPTSGSESWSPGVEIELPDLEMLFERVSMASPLARLVMEGGVGGGDGDSSGKGFLGGFKEADDELRRTGYIHPELKWKTIEADSRRVVHRIEKADKFQGVKTPLLRFRSSIEGPCVGEAFSNMIMNLEERKKWDDQVAEVDEMYPIQDLDSIDSLLGNPTKYGKCARVGVGYTLTKQGIISPREQLILGGMQVYENGATVLWGTEMEEFHNHLLPEGRRHTRGKSHLFSATMAPTSPNSFDVEYLLQMDVGGNVPAFMTTPAIVEIVKRLFDHAKAYYAGGDGSELDVFLKSRENQCIKQMPGYSIIDDECLLDVQDFDLDEIDCHHHAMDDLESLLFTP